MNAALDAVDALKTCLQASGSPEAARRDGYEAEPQALDYNRWIDAGVQSSVPMWDPVAAVLAYQAAAAGSDDALAAMNAELAARGGRGRLEAIPQPAGDGDVDVEAPVLPVSASEQSPSVVQVRSGSAQERADDRGGCRRHSDKPGRLMMGTARCALWITMPDIQRARECPKPRDGMDAALAPASAPAQE